MALCSQAGTPEVRTQERWGRTGRPGDASPPSQFCQKRGEDGAAKGAKGDCVERLGSMGGVKETVDGNVVMGLLVQAESAADGVFQLLVSRCHGTTGRGSLLRDSVALACMQILTVNFVLCSLVGSSTTTTLAEKVTGWPQATIVCTLTRCSLRCLSTQRSGSGCSMAFLWPTSRTRQEVQFAAFQRL